MVVNGNGSYGLVVSEPRIAMVDETYDDIKNNNQVSKLLYYIKNNEYIPEKNITYAYDNVIKLSIDYPNIFNNENFMMPLKCGYIDKKKFVSDYNNTEYSYGFDWISNSLEYVNIINSLLIHKNKLYQIVYEKGEKINYIFFDFIKKMETVYETLILCNTNHIYFDDFKYNNLIVHNDKIKIIDFEEPINLNVSENEYVKMIGNCKFHNPIYFPYDTMSLILLHEYTNNINKIGELDNNNYYKLLHINSHEFIDNAKYKYKLLNNLSELWNKYLQNYTVDIEAFDLKKFDKTDCITNDFDLKLHFETSCDIKLLEDNKTTININSSVFHDFVKMTNVSYLVEQHNNIKNANLTNQIFILNKKFTILTKKEHIDILSFLLTNINIYSFGFVFLDWLQTNIIKIINSDNRDDILKKIIEIVINCCVNFVIIDNQIYTLNRNYENLKKIIYL